jgi:hypothetical protein
MVTVRDDGSQAHAVRRRQLTRRRGDTEGENEKMLNLRATGRQGTNAPEGLSFPRRFVFSAFDPLFVGSAGRTIFDARAGEQMVRTADPTKAGETVPRTR